MKELYSIGEVCELLDLSTQTLRYYDREGVVVPAYVDPETGYRKYAYDQIGYIERVRYLQGLGLSLKEISHAITGGDVASLTAALRRRSDEVALETARLAAVRAQLMWYIGYYEHLDKTGSNDVPFEVEEPCRYILAEPIGADEPCYGTAGARLLRRRHSKALAGLSFLRQVGYLLDYEALTEGRFAPTHFYIYLMERPAAPCPGVMALPAGRYFCLRTR
ncbi:MAG TPA: MerR family transcriptional regulator, partial [Terriglobales bacterium]|nr:MerR family transcriptional regulator [Terriglobales bacterium]